jgi:hypothetical protein
MIYFLVLKLFFSDTTCINDPTVQIQQNEIRNKWNAKNSVKKKRKFGLKFIYGKMPCFESQQGLINKLF